MRIDSFYFASPFFFPVNKSSASGLGIIYLIKLFPSYLQVVEKDLNLTRSIDRDSTALPFYLVPLFALFGS